jgi:hypothetical protein|tara:strand:- start:432 stop:596 length:165 start_codon:yes stop_codon:yes gene_type:complete
MIQDYKTLFINFGTLGLSMTDIDVILKIILLITTIFYTLQKIYLLNKKNNDKEL